MTTRADTGRSRWAASNAAVACVAAEPVDKAAPGKQRAVGLPTLAVDGGPRVQSMAAAAGCSGGPALAVAEVPRAAYDRLVRSRQPGVVGLVVEFDSSPHSPNQMFDAKYTMSEPDLPCKMPPS
jgi:hypothetical protein